MQCTLACVSTNARKENFQELFAVRHNSSAPKLTTFVTKRFCKITLFCESKRKSYPNICLLYFFHDDKANGQGKPRKCESDVEVPASGHDVHGVRQRRVHVRSHVENTRLKCEKDANGQQKQAAHLPHTDTCVAGQRKEKML